MSVDFGWCFVLPKFKITSVNICIKIPNEDRNYNKIKPNSVIKFKIQIIRNNPKFQNALAKTKSTATLKINFTNFFGNIY